MATATAISDVGAVDIRDRADVVRQIKLVVVFGIVVALLVWFALTIENPTVLYTLGERISRETPAEEINGQALAWAAVVVAAVALVLAAINKVPKGALGVLLFVLVGIAFFTGFLVWNYADQDLARPLAMVNPLPGTVRLATPLVLGALAGVLCERSGVINIAIEGQLLMGAFFASVASSAFYSAEMGLLGGIAAGVAMAWMLGIFALRYQVNQVVLGVVLIAFAAGLTAFMLSQIPDSHKQYLNEPLVLERIAVPGLSEIPILGNPLFNQTLLVYLMYVSVFVVTFLLFETRWGLRVRSVGEHPKAADTVGIKVNRVRWQAVLFGGRLRGPRRRLLHRRLDRLLRQRRLGRQRLHRARRGDHGPLAPGRRDVRGALLRLHLDPPGAAAGARQDPRRAAARLAVPRDDHRGRRVRRPGPPAGRRRCALREELTCPHLM